MSLRRFSLVLLLALALATPLAASTSRYLVVPRRNSDAAPRLIANASEAAAHRVRRFEHAGSYAVDLTEEEADALRRSGEVESIAQAHTFYILELDAPAVPAISYVQQVMPWGVSAIHAPQVWPVTRGESVNVAVVDTGIDESHPDLAPAYAGGYNAIDPGKTPLDDHGHGTHVAGIIAAADNAFGTVGVAPRVKLWAVKMITADGSGAEENLIAALDWIIGRKKSRGGAWVANMSIGAPDATPALAAGVQRAIDAGIILVAASGNAQRPWMQYPASYRGVISVGAVDSKLVVAPFSQYSSQLSVVAPGVDIPSSYLRGKSTQAEVDTKSGTIPAVGIAGSPMAEVRAPFINCGYGRLGDFPNEARNRVCVIERSPAGSADALPFSEKAKNAKDAGALAAIIYNDDDVGRNDLSRWSLAAEDSPGYEFLLTVGMSFADATRLLSSGSGLITVSYRVREYGLMSGTSMASPHVAGTVALLLSLAPDANEAQIESVLERTTIDVATRGWDLRTSWGMVDALAAARALAPAAFGASPTPPPVIRRRSTRH